MANIMPPSIPRLPQPTEVDVTDPEALKNYLTILTAALSKHIAQRAPTNAALPERLLLSPNGRTFGLRVTDAGVVEVVPFGSAEDATVPP